MKPAAFDYHCPDTLAGALELMATLDSARALAGGQSLMPMLNLRLATPSHLVDLGRIAELTGIEATPDGLRIGAMTTQRAIEHSSLARERCPLLAEALAHVGHQQTRNRGTLGGSLCHLDPAAELPVVAAALEARLDIASRTGMRSIPFAEFPEGYLTSALRPEELLVRIEIADFRGGWGFEEFARRPADFAIVAAAALLRLGPDGTIEDVRIAIGGLGPAPVRLRTAESRLAGVLCTETAIDEAGTLGAELPAEGDDDNTPAYRQHLAGVLTRRALRKAHLRARQVQHV